MRLPIQPFVLRGMQHLPVTAILSCMLLSIVFLQRHLPVHDTGPVLNLQLHFVSFLYLFLWRFWCWVVDLFCFLVGVVFFCVLFGVLEDYFKKT